MYETLIWAGTVLLIVVFIAVFFKGEWQGFIRRLHRVKLPGIEAAGQQQEAEPKALPSGVEPRDSRILTRLDNALLLEREHAIRTDPDFSRETDPQFREQVLISHLAYMQILAHLEYIYGRIYASQLVALQTLNSQPNGVSTDEAQNFYDRFYSSDLNY